MIKLVAITIQKFRLQCVLEPFQYKEQYLSFFFNLNMAGRPSVSIIASSQV